MILLNPGPVTLTPRVREALVRGEMCHREPEFQEMLLDLRRRLESVYEEAAPTHAAVLLGGSGTAAVEAMLSTFATRGKKTLVVCNGVYGERMATMLERQGKPFVPLQLGWMGAVDADRIEAALAAEPSIASVALVHHETTTGRLNPLGPVAELCRERSVDLLVDGVSSFGGEELRFEAARPVAVAATANKCLHGAPGLSFVLADRSRLESGMSHAPSVYLDLVRYHGEQAAGWSPYTLPAQLCSALQEALVELEEGGGWRARHARYRALSRSVRSTLAELGVAPLLDEADCTVTMSAFRLPEGDEYDRIHDGLKALGFVVYAGQMALRKTIFRIANMGDIRNEDLDRLLGALSAVFGRPGR